VRSVRAAAQDTFRSLRYRNFRLFFYGQLVSQVGNWMTLVAQTLFVLRITDSGIALGVLAAAQFGPILLLGPWAGLVADRSDKRRLLLGVQTLAMLQSFALAALAFSGEPPVGAVYAVAFLGGITMAFDNPARRSFVVEMVPTEDINNAVSLNSALMTSSRVVGPALAGLAVTTVGFGWAFLADGLSYLAVLAGLWMMRSEELRPAPVTPKARGQVRAGLRYVRREPVLFVPMVMMAVVGTLSYNFPTVFPLFVIRDLGGTDSTFTLLFSVVSIGSVVGALVTARHADVGVRRVCTASLAYGASMAVMALAPGVAAALVIGVVLGLSSISFIVASTAIVQTRAAPEMRGRVLALQAMLFLGSTPVGGPIVGWVSEQFGARYAIALGAVAAVGAGLWGLAATRGVRERRSQDLGDLGLEHEQLDRDAVRGPEVQVMPEVALLDGRVGHPVGGQVVGPGGERGGIRHGQRQVVEPGPGLVEGSARRPVMVPDAEGHQRAGVDQQAEGGLVRHHPEAHHLRPERGGGVQVGDGQSEVGEAGDVGHGASVPDGRAPGGR
jgi:MFS family permease